MYLMKVDGVSHTRSGFPLTHRVLLDRGLRSGEGNFAWRKADSRPSIIRWHEVNEKTADEPASQKSRHLQTVHSLDQESGLDCAAHFLQKIKRIKNNRGQNSGCRDKEGQQTKLEKQSCQYSLDSRVLRST
jgi:hypothetical protein